MQKPMEKEGLHTFFFTGSGSSHEVDYDFQ